MNSINMCIKFLTPVDSNGGLVLAQLIQLDSNILQGTFHGIQFKYTIYVDLTWPGIVKKWIGMD